MPRIVPIPPVTISALVLAASTLLTISPVAHACSNAQQQVFKCSTKNNKVVEVCNVGNDAIYSFGSVGATPELLLRRPKTSLLYKEDAGAYSLTFHNRTTSYTITYSGQPGPIAASVEVEANLKHLASVKCNGAEITANFLVLGLSPQSTQRASNAAGETTISAPLTPPRWTEPKGEKPFTTAIGKFSIIAADYSSELRLNGRPIVGDIDFYDERLDVGGVLDYGNKVALLIYTGNSGNGGYHRAVAIMVDRTGRITSFADGVNTDSASYRLSGSNWISEGEPIAGSPRRISINQDGIRVDTLPRSVAKGRGEVNEWCPLLYETVEKNCPNLRPQDCRLLAKNQDAGVFGETQTRADGLSHFTTGEDRLLYRAFDDPRTDYVALVRVCSAACSGTRKPYTLKEFEQKVCRGR